LRLDLVAARDADRGARVGHGRHGLALVERVLHERERALPREAFLVGPGAAAASAASAAARLDAREHGAGLLADRTRRVVVGHLLELLGGFLLLAVARHGLRALDLHRE